MFKTGKDNLAKSSKTFFDLEAIDIDGKLFKFSSLKNKKAIIVVNVASFWGLTKAQYTGLVELY